MKVKIKHVDGKTDVIAKVFFSSNGVISLDYKYEGMSYGRTIDMCEAIKLKIITKCPHYSVVPILGFDNVVVGEVCTCCGKKI